VFADIQVAEQSVEIFRFVDIVIIEQSCKEQTLTELARTDEKLTGIRFVLQHLDIPRLVNIRVIVCHDMFEIGYTVRQSFRVLIFVHHHFF
jgi:hypothetical protein